MKSFSKAKQTAWVLAGACLLASACMLSPRNGQFFPNGPSTPIPFSGYVREPNLGILIQAVNVSTNQTETVAVATSASTAADCDVTGQCWYAFNTTKVLPSRYWRRLAGNALSATVSAKPVAPAPGNEFIVTFDTGTAVNQCLEQTYNRFGGTQAALNCSSAMSAVIFTCRNAPC